jgi:hypothetical protein
MTLAVISTERHFERNHPACDADGMFTLRSPFCRDTHASAMATLQGETAWRYRIALKIAERLGRTWRHILND